MKGIVAHYRQSGLSLDDTRKWAATVLPWVAYEPYQVVAAGAEMPSLDDDSSGIYFLMRRGKICYIGKSTALLTRIEQHRSRPFDRVAVIAGIPDDCCTSLEAAYVNAWGPPWNAARCVAVWDSAEKLRRKLARMDLGLICDQPEQPPLTEAEIERFCKALEGF